jgi:hypothetical protein
MPKLILINMIYGNDFIEAEQNSGSRRHIRGADPSPAPELWLGQQQLSARVQDGILGWEKQRTDSQAGLWQLRQHDSFCRRLVCSHIGAAPGIT